VDFYNAEAGVVSIAYDGDFLEGRIGILNAQSAVGLTSQKIGGDAIASLIDGHLEFKFRLC